MKGFGGMTSNHCLDHLQKDWGPRPFRFFNRWLLHPEFKEFFIQKCGSYNIEGWGGFVLKEKLKLLKADLKVWNREVFGNLETSIAQKTTYNKMLDIIDDSLGLEDHEIIKRNQISAELNWVLIWKDNLFYQKSKAKWVL